jgi:hypothetical protein
MVTDWRTGTQGCPRVREDTPNDWQSLRMAETEKTVSGLVHVLRSAERLLAAKASDLITQPEWSEVTFRFEPSAWGRLGSEHKDLGFWGYVDAERVGIGGFAWIVDLVRVDERWRVSRALNVNRNTTNYQETVTDLPDRTLESTDDLIAELPGLVMELLDLPVSEAESGS